MLPNAKKKVKDKARESKGKPFPAWLKQILLFIYELSLFRIGAIVVSIIIVAAVGDLFTKNGLILAICLLVFLILFYLKRRFEKDDKS